MLSQLKGRLPGPPEGGIYVSCIARGEALFGEPGVESGLIRETLGDFPLIGFFANGEISRDRLYGHTGVLDGVHADVAAPCRERDRAQTCCVCLSGSSFRRS